MKISPIALSLCLTVSLAAQTPKLPDGPLIKMRAPEFSRWVVAFSPALPEASKGDADAGEPPAGPPSGVPTTEVTKTGKIYHVQFVDARGEKSDVWVGGPISAREPAAQGANAEFVAPPPDKDSTNPLYVNFSKSDFDKFGWISAANFRGIKKMFGRECLYFSDKVKVGTTSATKEGGGDGGTGTVDLFDHMEAYVDLETRLPVARSSSDGAALYKFLAPPTTMLVVPQSIQDLVRKQAELDESLSRKAVKPY